MCKNYVSYSSMREEKRGDLSFVHTVFDPDCYKIQPASIFFFFFFFFCNMIFELLIHCLYFFYYFVDFKRNNSLHLVLWRCETYFNLCDSLIFTLLSLIFKHRSAAVHTKQKLFEILPHRSKKQRHKKKKR